MNEFMTKKEAAEYLKVSIETINSYIDKGLLTSYTAPIEIKNSPVRLKTEEVKKFFSPKRKN